MPSSEEEFPEHLTRRTIGLEPTERPIQPFIREQLRRTPAAEIEPEHKTPETTETQDSFTTAPEISKEFEQFINVIPDQKKPEITISTMATAEGKKPETTNEMPVDKPEQRGELKLNHPKPFTGKREDLKKFLQDVKLYLHVNEKIYDHPAKKISFALSFMNEGDAASWKEQLLEEVMAKDPFDLGTWDVFEKNLKNAFQPYDAPGDTLEEMKTLKMIVTKSELDETSPAVIDYYRETLSFPLQQRILSLENPPKTLKEWYDWAAKLDNNWRKMQRILG